MAAKLQYGDTYRWASRVPWGRVPVLKLASTWLAISITAHAGPAEGSIDKALRNFGDTNCEMRRSAAASQRDCGVWTGQRLFGCRLDVYRGAIRTVPQLSERVFRQPLRRKHLANAQPDCWLWTCGQRRVEELTLRKCGRNHHVEWKLSQS
ncbi:uncharacterized protein IWZ02DRAFT_465355 [Phyllosticta citriasiana]|uniref:Uncharacterized protein n=1 Tax=Phyllosticta citriasiana TaxID=595635 RepID=A0ABR1KXI0_9PEZI